MNLSTAYSTVIKYGLAPQEEFEEWIKKAEEAKQIDPKADIHEGGSHPDNFFADWLADNDDPRSEIVRKDLEIRSAPGTNWLEKENNHTATKLGVELNNGKKEHILSRHSDPHGYITAEKMQTPDKKQTFYRVYWLAASRIPQQPITYAGFFTPEEFKHFASQVKPDLDISKLS